MTSMKIHEIIGKIFGRKATEEEKRKERERAVELMSHNLEFDTEEERQQAVAFFTEELEEPENKTGCRAFPYHTCEYYQPEHRDRIRDITNFICHYHNSYYDFSAHIFHRELAERIDRYINEEIQKDS